MHKDSAVTCMLDGYCWASLPGCTKYLLFAYYLQNKLKLLMSNRTERLSAFTKSPTPWYRATSFKAVWGDAEKDPFPLDRACYAQCWPPYGPTKASVTHTLNCLMEIHLLNASPLWLPGPAHTTRGALPLSSALQMCTCCNGQCVLCP